MILNILFHQIALARTLELPPGMPRERHVQEDS
jgi:hypothetical protein